MALPILAAGLAAKGLGGLFGLFGKKKRAKEANANAEAERFARQRRAEIGVQAGEDTRLGRLSLAKALLGGLPGQTAGGQVNTNAQIDPATLQALGVRRNYDFSKAFAAPKVGAGATTGFLEGLTGKLGNATLDYGLGKIGSPPSPVGGFEGEADFDPTQIPGMGALTQEDVKKGYGG